MQNLLHKTTVLLIFRRLNHIVQLIVENIALLQHDRTRYEHASVVHAIPEQLYIWIDKRNHVFQTKFCLKPARYGHDGNSAPFWLRELYSKYLSKGGYRCLWLILCLFL